MITKRTKEQKNKRTKEQKNKRTKEQKKEKNGRLQRSFPRQKWAKL